MLVDKEVQEEVWVSQDTQVKRNMVRDKYYIFKGELMKIKYKEEADNTGGR